MNRLMRVWQSLIYLITLTMISGSLTLISAQEIEDRRLSINLNSGVIYAMDGAGFMGPLTGNFNIASLRRPLFGGSLQYSITPAWSIDASLITGEFKNANLDDPFFQTDFTAFSVSGVTNLNNLFNLGWRPARYINPHLSIGLGMLNSDIVAEGLDTRSLSLMLTGGAGISLFLTRWADLFVNYDYYIVGDDLLDGYSGSGGSDQFAALGAGIRLNFGSGPSQLASWSATREPRLPEPVAQREDPEPEPQPGPEPAPAPEPEPEIEPEPAELTDETRDWLTGLAIFIQSPQMNRLDGLDETIARAAERAEQRREAERLAEQRRAEVAAGDEREQQDFMDTPRDGQYLQIASVSDTELARQMKADLIDTLENVLSNPSDRVIVHHHQNFYRILIGPFARAAQAREVHAEISDRYPDAFVITYPR